MKTLFFFLSFILAATISSQGQVFTTFGGNASDTIACDSVTGPIKGYIMRFTPTVTSTEPYVYTMGFDIDSLAGEPSYVVSVERLNAGTYRVLHTFTSLRGDTSFSFTNTTGYHGTLAEGFRLKIMGIDSTQLIKVTNGQFEYWPKK